jgi:hypothetical protein
MELRKITVFNKIYDVLPVLAKEHVYQDQYFQSDFPDNKLELDDIATNLDFYNYSSNTLTVTLKKDGTLVKSFILQPEGSNGDGVTDETFPSFDEIDISGTDLDFMVIVRS